jgi:hypothetical protein
MPRTAWQWGGDNNAVNDPIRAPSSTLLYLCFPLVLGSVGGDCRFPIIHMEKIQNKKPFKCRDSAVQRYLSSFPQQVASHTGKPPHGAGTPSKPKVLSTLQRLRANGHKISWKRKLIQINLYHSTALTAVICWKLAIGKIKYLFRNPGFLGTK